MRAYIMVTTKAGTSEEVVARIRKIPGVLQADSVYGRFDAVAVVQARDLVSLTRLIYKTIEKQPNIVHTESLLTLA